MICVMHAGFFRSVWLKEETSHPTPHSPSLRLRSRFRTVVFWGVWGTVTPVADFRRLGSTVPSVESIRCMFVYDGEESKTSRVSAKRRRSRSGGTTKCTGSRLCCMPYSLIGSPGSPLCSTTLAHATLASGLGAFGRGGGRDMMIGRPPPT